MIKILYIHNIVEISGGEQSLLNLWKNLDRLQFEPYLMVPQEGALSYEAKRIGVKVGIMDFPKLHIMNIVKILKTALNLRRFLISNNINIIHSYGPRNNILSALVAKCSLVKVVWHERNLIYGNEPDRTKQFLFLPDFIICNSKAVAMRFEECRDFSKKVKVALNGVDLEDFKPMNAQDGMKVKFGAQGMKTVGMVTNLNIRKRVEFLIETIPFVLRARNNVKFVIIGGEFPDVGGHRMRELQAMAKNLGVDGHVVFTGFQEDVRPYLNALDLFVHVTEKEACSRAIIEAMACGKPVVAVNDGGNPELIQDGYSGMLIVPHGREVFAESIITLLTDDHRRMTMGQSARQRAVECFDVRRNAQTTQKIYLECQA